MSRSELPYLYSIIPGIDYVNPPLRIGDQTPRESQLARFPAGAADNGLTPAIRTKHLHAIVAELADGQVAAIQQCQPVGIA
jgi:hypothetical protein